MLGLLPVSLQSARFVGVEVDHLPAALPHLVPLDAVQAAVTVAQFVPALKWADSVRS